MNNISKHFFKHKSPDIKKEMEIVNLLTKQKMYNKALIYLYHITNDLKINSINLQFRIFDILVVIYQYFDAIELLESLVIENSTDQIKYQKRLDIINSLLAQNYRLTITTNSPKITIDKSIRKCTFIKGKDLIKFKIIFTSTLDIDYIYINNQKRQNPFEQIIPVVKHISNSTTIYEAELNLLSVEKIYFVSQLDCNSLESAIQNDYSLSINTIKTVNILYGKDGWLFLGNDGNKSELQFKGLKLISDQELKQWKAFYSNFERLKIPHLLLLTPSKEQVFPQYYPHQRADTCPIDQLLKIIQSSNNYYYPLSTLKQDIYSYSKTDTHWSHKAANDIFYDILNKFKIDHDSFITRLSTSIVSNIGDLSSKCSPHLISDYYMLNSTTSVVNKYLTFTNYLLTQGAIHKYINPNAHINKKIIIFGDSFMNIAIPFYVEFFETVILVRSNASVIFSLIEHEQPDFLISEITERFIIYSPSFFNDISDYKPCIRRDLTPNIKNNIISSPRIYDNFYNDYLSNYKKLLID